MSWTHHQTKMSSSISPSAPAKEEVTIVTVRPSSVRLNAHTEALQDSLKRSRPGTFHAGVNVNSSPNKLQQQQQQQQRISTSPRNGCKQNRGSLPLPVRADLKGEAASKEKTRDSNIVRKDSLWSISGVKLEKLYKNLLKKPKKKKEISPEKNAKSNGVLDGNNRESPEKFHLVRTSSEPRTAGKSKFYLVENFRDDSEEAVKVEDGILNGGQENKKEKFFKKKSKSSSLLLKTSEGAKEIRRDDENAKVKVKEAQGNSRGSPGEAIDPLCTKERARMDEPRHQQGFEPKVGGPGKHETLLRTPTTTPTTTTTTTTTTSTGCSRNGKTSLSLAIQQLEREPRRSSRNVGANFTNGDVDDDDDDDYDLAGDGARASEPSKTPQHPPQRRVPSNGGRFSPPDHVTGRKKLEPTTNNGTGTGTITSGESCPETTSPMSGERSTTFSDSGYSVTSNDVLITDTGYLVLDSVAAATKARPPAASEGSRNVNAGYIHQPFHQPKEDRIQTEANPPKRNPDERDAKPQITPQVESTCSTFNTFNTCNTCNNFNTFPLSKRSRKTEGACPPVDLVTSTADLPSADVTESIKARSRCSHRSLGFSREEFDSLKKRAKSVEMAIPSRSKRGARSGNNNNNNNNNNSNNSNNSSNNNKKRRACSISRERNLITVITRTEETTIYTKKEKDEVKARPEVVDRLSVNTGDVPAPPGRTVQLPAVDSKGNKLFMTTDFPFHVEESQNRPELGKKEESVKANDDRSGKSPSPNSRAKESVVVYENPLYANQAKCKNFGFESQKLPAISYFDGTRWLTSDETNSEEDQRDGTTRVEGGRRAIRTRCAETQTSEDYEYHFPSTVDQFSQTNSFNGATKGHAYPKVIIRRDSVKSVIAHEYGEMYSIFKEIPATLTFLKASLVPDRESSSTNQAGPSTTARDDKPSVGFGFLMLPTSSTDHGVKIHDGEQVVPGQFICYRFEPVLEHFELLV